MFSCFRLPGSMKVWINIRSVWMIAFLLYAGKVGIVLVCPMCEGLGVEKLVIILPLLNRNRPELPNAC